MNSSLRSQFLIPIVAMLLLICSAVTLVSWKIASRTTLAATEERLRNVLKLCSVSRFPLTEPVLNQIGEFSRCKIKVVPQVATTNTLFTSEEMAGTFDSYAIRLERDDNRATEGSPSYLLALSDPKDRFALSSQAFWLPMATGILSTLAFAPWPSGSQTVWYNAWKNSNPKSIGSQADTMKRSPSNSEHKTPSLL